MSDNIITSKFGVKIPKTFTSSFNTFSVEMTDSIFLGHYIIMLDEYTNEDIKSEALNEFISFIEDKNNPAANNLVDSLKNSVGNSIFKSASYEKIFGQMVVCKVVDNFICYLKEILCEIIAKKPAILKSNESEKLEDILSFDTIEDLRKYIIEKKMNSLFYNNIDVIEKFFTDKLKVNIFGKNKEDVSLIIKQRNLIVHNRAIVSNEFIKLFPSYGDMEGKQITYSYGEVERINIFINNFLKYLF